MSIQNGVLVINCNTIINLKIQVRFVDKTLS